MSSKKKSLAMNWKELKHGEWILEGSFQNSIYFELLSVLKKNKLNKKKSEVFVM